MRELNECTAEVFRRSEKRIKERRRTRNRVLICCIPLCLIITIWSVTILPGIAPLTIDKANSAEEFEADNESNACEYFDGSTDFKGLGSINSFTFSLTWDCYGISSYDSKTGKLVKTKHATNPADYITTYQLTTEQKQKIYDLILNLNVTDYPDVYNPHTNGLESSPSMTLILSVNTDTVQKTITAADIALTYEADNREGQKFLSVCKAIQDILTSTEEWQSLPEYEFVYS